MDNFRIKSIIRSSIFGVFVATVAIVILFLIASLLVLCSNLSVKLISPISVVVGGVGSFIAAYVISRILKTKGILTGLVFGIVIDLVVFALTFLTTGIIFSLSMLTKFIVIIISSCLGGIFGVNSRS